MKHENGLTKSEAKVYASYIAAAIGGLTSSGMTDKDDILSIAAKIAGEAIMDYTNVVVDINDSFHEQL